MASDIEDVVASSSASDGCVLEDDRAPASKLRRMRDTSLARGMRQFAAAVTSGASRRCEPLVLFVGVAELAWSVRPRSTLLTPFHQTAEASTCVATTHWVEYHLVRMLWLDEPPLSKGYALPRQVPSFQKLN